MAAGLPLNLYTLLAPWLLPIIESVLLVAAVALTFYSRHRIPHFLSYNSGFSRLARRKKLSILLVGVATLALRLAIIPAWGIPRPSWHDEFSFLLAADTFAHGRLTNPPHPMWKHFEGFHIIQKPTYMSMYPPGQGLILAAGERLGNPWIGQLVVTAMMCSCLCWMLQGWMPAPWALLGACLAVLRFALLSYWVNSYFGTSLPALGGMLLLGAYPRIRRKARWGGALVMALGLAILANTRPYEGLIFSLPILMALLWWGAEQRRFPSVVLLRRIVMPAAIVLLVTFAGMGYYFWRVTGSPMEMPYTVNRQTYAVAPYFVWQKPRAEPVYRHAEMRDFYVNRELRSYQEGSTFWGFVRRLAKRFGTLWLFFVGPVLSLPLFAAAWIFRDLKMRLPLCIAGAVIAGNIIETWTLVHYLAPAVGLLYLLLMQGMRHLRLWRHRNREVGHGLVRAVCLVSVAMVVLRVAAMASGIRIEPPRPTGLKKRNAIEEQLRLMPGKQLVIVHYAPQHVPHEDWINNGADIDGEKIVWARDMGDKENLELVLYFKDRKIWRVQADDPAPRLEPYPASPQ